MSRKVITVILSMSLVIFIGACDFLNSSGKDKKTAALIDELNKDMVLIEEGEFIRGSNKEDTEGIQARYGFAAPLFVDEHPQTKIDVSAFWIDRYEVTNSAYKKYILSTRRMMPSAWVNNGYALTEEKLRAMEEEKLRQLALDYFKLDVDTRKMDSHQLVAAMLTQQQYMDKLPVSGVNWFDAREFCQWRDGRLPSEVEWEKAARGVNGQEFPWGNEWDPAMTNTGDDGKWEEGIAPVGSYAGNKSPYGLYDMSGNVWEWVNDWYQPYENSRYQSQSFGEKNRVLRGGGGGVGHYAISYFFRAATRQFSEPEMESDDVGFRCARDD